MLSLLTRFLFKLSVRLCMSGLNKNVCIKVMEDLLASQIRESCRLALPEGLTDLMWDISREVLRAQPADVFRFIADYLAVLLVTRENLSIASRLCGDPCDNICHRELEEELRFIGLNEHDAKEAKDLIQKHFKAGHVKGSELLAKLLKRFLVTEEQLVLIEDAIRTAFLRHQVLATVHETSSDSDIDDTTRAVKHTLHIYRNTKPSEEEYNRAAENVQAAYRAYGVRRKRDAGKDDKRVHPLEQARGRIRFDSDDNEISTSTTDDNMTEPTDYLYGINVLKPCMISTASSVSLAGSHLHLPHVKPYSAHDNDMEQLVELPEMENTTIDYMEESTKVTDYDRRDSVKRISFDFTRDCSDVVDEVEDVAIDVDNISQTTVDEEISGDEHSYVGGKPDKDDVDKLKFFNYNDDSKVEEKFDADDVHGLEFKDKNYYSGVEDKPYVNKTKSMDSNDNKDYREPKSCTSVEDKVTNPKHYDINDDYDSEPTSRVDKESDFDDDDNTSSKIDRNFTNNNGNDKLEESNGIA